jgi:hypothetical protein
VSLGICAGSSSARRLDVPAPYPTISAALEEAESGDVIEIAAGIYSPASNGERFPLELRGRRVVLQGAGAWRTILDAGRASRHFRFAEGDSSTLQDVALVGGLARGGGGAVRIEDSFTVIRRVRILDCESETAGNAIALSHSRATLENVLATHNGMRGATILLEQDPGTRIRRCTFEENGGIAIGVRGGAPEISRNVFARPGIPQGLALAILVQDPRGECGAFGEGNFFEACEQGEAFLLSEMRALENVAQTDLKRAIAFSGSRRGEFRFDVDAGAFSGLAPLENPEDEAPPKKEAPAGSLDATPNPFSPQTTITYTVAAQTVVDLGIFNVLGQRIRTLFAGDRPPGEYWEIWDGRDDLGREMPPGVYYARITQGTETESKRIVLVR